MELQFKMKIEIVLFLLFVFCEYVNPFDIDRILALPEEFNLNVSNPSCVSTMINPGLCEASSQIVAVSVLSDRLCIKTKGSRKFTFSPQCILLSNL
jgi:hypothetical protein